MQSLKEAVVMLHSNLTFPYCELTYLRKQYLSFNASLINQFQTLLSKNGLIYRIR